MAQRYAFIGRSSTRYLFIFLLLLRSLTVSGQTIRYVSATGTNANPASATSWVTSTTNLQGAINISSANDQVWVKAGTYNPPSQPAPPATPSALP